MVVTYGLIDDGKAAEILKVPEGYRVVAFTPVGIPEGEADAPPRLDIAEVVHKEAWKG